METIKASDSFDLRYISMGAGVQSSAMYLLALDGAFGAMPDVAIFADTQAEPEWVYRQLDYLRSVGEDRIPIHVSTVGSITDKVWRSLDTKGGGFASIPVWMPNGKGDRVPGRRQCTREFKIDAVKLKARELLGLEPGQRAQGRVTAEEWIGISLDEATRAKPSRTAWITTRWPLLLDRPMRRAEILRWMAANGHPEPKRSACFFCPYRDNASWREIRDGAPEQWAEAVHMDHMMRQPGSRPRGLTADPYLHKSCTPLAEVDLDADDGQMDLFENECEGMCGV